MHDCIFKLLRAGDEESLESMCKLLFTIGKDLDSEKAKVNSVYIFSPFNKWGNFNFANHQRELSYLAWIIVVISTFRDTFLQMINSNITLA